MPVPRGGARVTMGFVPSGGTSSPSGSCSCSSVSFRVGNVILLFGSVRQSQSNFESKVKVE